MIPMRFLSKMGTYAIRTQGVTVNVRVVDHAALIETGLSELRSQIGAPTAVGLHVNKSVLQLCVGTRCLMVLLGYSGPMPHCLKHYLANQETCFVGVDMCVSVHHLKNFHGVACESGVEVSELAARVLKKPRLWGAPLPMLGAEVGLGLEEFPKYDLGYVKSFSEVQIKHAIQGVYGSQLIGSKLLGML